MRLKKEIKLMRGRRYTVLYWAITKNPLWKCNVFEYSSEKKGGKEPRIYFTEEAFVERIRWMQKHWVVSVGIRGICGWNLKEKSQSGLYLTAVLPLMSFWNICASVSLSVIRGLRNRKITLIFGTSQPGVGVLLLEI